MTGFPLAERGGPCGCFVLVGVAGERFGQGEEFLVRLEHGPAGQGQWMSCRLWNRQRWMRVRGQCLVKVVVRGPLPSRKSSVWISPVGAGGVGSTFQHEWVRRRWVRADMRWMGWERPVGQRSQSRNAVRSGRFVGVWRVGVEDTPH